MVCKKYEGNGSLCGIYMLDLFDTFQCFQAYPQHSLNKCHLKFRLSDPIKTPVHKLHIHYDLDLAGSFSCYSL